MRQILNSLIIYYIEQVYIYNIALYFYVSCGLNLHDREEGSRLQTVGQILIYPKHLLWEITLMESDKNVIIVKILC